MLKTTRLSLVPFTAAQLVAIIEQPDSFEKPLGYAAADGLRSFFASGEVSTEWLESLRSRTGPDPWSLGFAVIHDKGQKVIGSAGFKGPPSADGAAEVAYAIVPSFEGQGYASEALQALVDFAFGQGVSTLHAHTLPEVNASGRVLTKAGFSHTGEVNDPDDGPVWRWELRRSPG